MTKYSASILAIAIATVTFAMPAFAQTAPDAQTAAPADVAPPQQDIVILGTRRTDRTSTTAASPVDIISAADLTAQPTANVMDSVKNLIPSFFVGQNTISDASSVIRAPSLRGLPSDNVLVMINGKRYNRSALVQVYNGGDTGLSLGSQGSDISAIPSIGIGNLQVLRDGATAQYGSDAIAGVMNFGLRKDAGFELQGRYGQYYKNDGDSRQIAGYAGFHIGDRGFLSVAGEYFNDLGTSRGATRPSALRFAQANPSLASAIPNYPGPAQIWGSSPTHGYKAVLNASLPVGDHSELYLFGNSAHTYIDESFNYRPTTTITEPDQTGVGRTYSANGAFIASGAPKLFYLTPCPTGNATCPAGGFVQDSNTFSFLSIYPGGFTPRFVGKSYENYGTIGWRGDAGKLHYDLSGTLARHMVKLSMYNSLNISYGPLSQTSFDLGKITQEELVGNLDLSYPLEVGLAAPLTISGGLEYRKETFKQGAGDAQSYGAGPYATGQNLYVQTAPGVYAFSRTTAASSPTSSGYAGTDPSSAGAWSQNNYGAYLDLETDLVQGLSVGAAGRYEHYNTFGDAWVGKLSGIWKATDWVSVRGAVGTGYHAPSPGQSHTQIVTTSFNAGVQVQTGTFPTGSAVAQAFGATPLKPEKSTNAGAGLVFTPNSHTTLTVDGYSIKVKDRIFISQPFSVNAAALAAYPILGGVGLGGNVQYFTNGFDTLTHGVDVVGTWRGATPFGRLTLTLAYNYNLTKVSNIKSTTLFGNTVATIGGTQIVNIGHFAPNHRVNLAAALETGAFAFNLRGNYYGPWRDDIDFNSNANLAAGNPGQTFRAKVVTDFDVSYTFNRMFTLTVGAQNLFDTYPDKVRQNSAAGVYVFPSTGSTYDGQIYPRPGGPFGMNGGFYYTRLRVKL